MRYRNGYCSRCSTSKEDCRTIKIDDAIFTCMNCGFQHLIVQEAPASPYFYLEVLKPDEEEHDR